MDVSEAQRLRSLEDENSRLKRLVADLTRLLDELIAEHERPESLRSDNGPEFCSRRMLGWAEERKIALVHIQPWVPDAERVRGELPRLAVRRVPERALVPHAERCADYTGRVTAEV